MSRPEGARIARSSPRPVPRLAWVWSLAFLLTLSCSLRKRAVNTLADVLGEAEQVYLSDEDPELVAAALPFNLKTLETLLVSNPDHRGLLLAATKAFLLYAYGFVEPQALRLEPEDFEQAEAIRDRATRLYLRAYRYGLRGLEVEHPGLGSELPRRPEEAASRLQEEDVPLAVWTAAALGSAIQLSKDEPGLLADLAVVGALLERSLELDEDFEEGTIHELLIRYESQRLGGDPERVREHYQRALALSAGRRCSVWLTWAESVSIPRQDREEFLDLLEQVERFDVEAHPQHRLLNLLAQRRARWLAKHVEDYFLEGAGES